MGRPGQETAELIDPLLICSAGDTFHGCHLQSLLVVVAYYYTGNDKRNAGPSNSMSSRKTSFALAATSQIIHTVTDFRRFATTPIVRYHVPVSYL